MLSSLEGLRAFAAVYEARTLTAAGKRLSLTTNAVSLRIQKLEAELGTRLFVRTTRTVAPTEEARVFHARVVRILAELEEAEDERAPARGGLRGVVRLGDATYGGLGIGVRPVGECARAEAEGRLERVLPGHCFQGVEVVAMIPKGRARLARVAACLEVVREAVVELA